MAMEEGGPQKNRTAIVGDESLRSAVAGSRSWRGVLRFLGLTESASGTARRLRHRCDAVGIGYAHFTGQRSWTDADLAAAALTAASWQQLLADLGYSTESGSSRGTVRRRAALQGVDLSHLDGQHSTPTGNTSIAVPPENLRAAGSMIVAAILELHGARVSWPMEPAPYDLLVDLGARLSKVQVKTAARRQGGSYDCYLTRSTYIASSRWPQRERYAAADVDDFGIVAGDLSVYLIPHSVVGHRAAIRVRCYQQFLVGRLPSPSMYAATAPGTSPENGL